MLLKPTTYICIRYYSPNMLARPFLNFIYPLSVRFMVMMFLIDALHLACHWLA